MTDEELDAVLARSRSTIPPSAATETQRLVRAARPERSPRRVRRWVLPVAVAGALALTGGANLAAAQMEIWPYVGMPAGNLRNSTPIPVLFTDEDGRQHNCGAWIEYANATGDQIEALNAEIASRNWQGFGQRIYDAGPPSDDPHYAALQRIDDGLTETLHDLVSSATPDVYIPRREDRAAGPPPEIYLNGPHVQASGVRCD